MGQAFLHGGTRTAIGRYGGALACVRTDDWPHTSSLN